jgi:hypothetical protein
MAADVAEGAQLTLIVANDDDGFAGNVGGEKTFGVRDCTLRAIYLAARLAESSDELPGAPKNARLLDFKDGGIGVKTRGECLGTLDLVVDVEMVRFRLHQPLKVESSKLKSQSKGFSYFDD